jgi:hypothetical protein
MGNKIQTRDIKHSKTTAWEIDCNSLTLEEALKILNPDNYYIYRMAEKRGAYKRIVIELDNANPSEALEILLKAKQVCDVSCIEMCNNCQKKSAYNSIKQALLKAQKEHKALDIIKEKKVNILLLELAENVDEYNERIVPNGQLTEEEFNLLKEILE